MKSILKGVPVFYYNLWKMFSFFFQLKPATISVEQSSHHQPSGITELQTKLKSDLEKDSKASSTPLNATGTKDKPPVAKTEVQAKKKSSPTPKPDDKKKKSCCVIS